MRTLIVHNLKSGFGSDAIFEMARQLVQQGDECVLRMLPETGGAEEAVRDAEAFDAVVVSGGDGTVTNLLFALANRGVPTCVFPSGTANLLAASIGNAHESAALAHTVLDGRLCSLDLGEISWTDNTGSAQKRGFGVMSGLGFDAQLMADAQGAKTILGEAAYFAAVLANLRPRYESFTISVDGLSYTHRGIACLVANTAMIQGEIELVPGCRMDDGLLDVIMVESEDALHLITPLFAGVLDPSGTNIERPYISNYRGRDIKISVSHPLPLEIDGDIVADKVSTFYAHALEGAASILVDPVSPYAHN